MTVGFVSGCFDWLAPGHVKLFQASKEHCDVLHVLMADDETVHHYKGSGRPLLKYAERGVLMEACTYVDAVHKLRKLPNESNQQHLIETITPDIYIEGADATDQDIRTLLHVLGIHRVTVAHAFSDLHIRDILRRYDSQRYDQSQREFEMLVEVAGL